MAEAFSTPEVANVIGLFHRFVRETGYVTVAERRLDSADYPAADLLVPGSLVFLKATGPVKGTSPVGTFPPNGFYDMTGNVREWTRDFFTMQHDPEPSSPSCAPSVIEGERFPRKVIKGGSHLCAPNYCLRYRPAARQGKSTDTSTAHIGFRRIVRSG